MRFLKAVLLIALLLPAGAEAGPPPPPRITITLDDTAVSRLIALIDAHDDSPAGIDAWLALPANQELLKVGAQESDLTEAQLRDNVRAVIDGTADDKTQPRQSMGRVLLSPPADYRKMLDALHAHAAAWLSRCAQRDAAYAPAGAPISQRVYLHVGGDWDAINRDGAIFINIAFFHDYYRPSWDGLDALISHETFHAVQNQVFGNPQQTDTGDNAFLTVLSKIQREGTARLVETNADPDPYAPYTYGFFFRASNSEALRLFPQSPALLQTLYQACYPRLDPDRLQAAVAAGLDRGGPYYVLGHGIALAIEREDGRAALVETVRRGPLDFFTRYLRLTRRHSDLPPLPADAAAAILRLQARAGRR